MRQRRVLRYGLSRLLQQYGIVVCDTELGRQLGGGLFEPLPRRDYLTFQ